jgi:hypothetical protein
MLECFAPRDGGKDALWLRYKSKDNFFACAQKDILSTESRNIQKIESFAGTPFTRRTRPLMPLKAIKVYT